MYLSVKLMSVNYTYTLIISQSFQISYKFSRDFLIVSILYMYKCIIFIRLYMCKIMSILYDVCNNTWEIN